MKLYDVLVERFLNVLLCYDGARILNVMPPKRRENDDDADSMAKD